MAVHFGHFPADGQPVQMAQAVDTTPYPAAVAMTGAAPAAPTRFAQQTARPDQRTAPAAEQPRRRVALARPVTRRDDELDRSARVGAGSRSEGRRPLRPVRGTAEAAPREQQAEPVRTAAVQPQRQLPAPPPARPSTTPPVSAPARERSEPVRVASAPPLEIPPAMRQDAPAPARQETPQPNRQEASREPAPAPQQAPLVRYPPAPIAEAQVPQETPVVLQEAPPTAARQEVPAPATSEPAASATAPAPAPAVADFSDVAALVQSLPTEEEPPRPQPARTAPQASRPAATPARTAPAQTRAGTPGAERSSTPSRTAARTPAPPPHPSRHWVQIANGERSAFAFQLGRLRQAAPELLRTRQAWWARNGSSERLLVGPFATAAEAQAFVTQLSRKSVAAFPWTSDAGEEVERLPAR
jgi:hypothetical protein